MTGAIMGLETPQGKAPGLSERDNRTKAAQTRRGGMRPLGLLVQPLAKQALGKKGRAFAAFLADWPAVVGEQTAAHCLPQKLGFPDRERHREGTLTLRVANQAWATELEHRAPQLLEQINVYFGYTAVARLRFTSGPLPARPGTAPRPQVRDPEPGELAALDRRLETIEDPDLRAAMRRLGARVLGRRS